MEPALETITERIDAVTHIPPEYRQIICPPPKSIKWELVSACNYACSYCGINARENKGLSKEKTRINFDLFKRASKEAYDAGVRECGLFFVGEATMDPPLLIDCLKWAKSLGPDNYVFLTTNGSLCDSMLAGELMQNGLDSLKFSINAADAIQFEQVMGVKPKLFERALNNLKAAYELRNEMGYATRVYASSIMFHGEQQAKMADLLEKRVLPYVDEHYWLPCFSEMAHPSQAKNEALGFKPWAGNQGRLDNLRPPVMCWSVVMEGHVRVDGHLSACCFGATDAFDMGDLNTQPFMEAWNSKTFQELRRKHLEGDVHNTVCESCIYG